MVTATTLLGTSTLKHTEVLRDAVRVCPKTDRSFLTIAEATV